MPADPFKLFKEWYEATTQDPTPVALATATAKGVPAVRMVLLKGFGPKGFIFYGNEASRKAEHLSQNPKAALCFYWDDSRQVRVEGGVQPLGANIADAYFNSRSRQSQLSAWASKQSQTLGRPEDFTTALKQVEQKFADTNPIPRPPFWNGWLLEPVLMEFWQQQPHRRHLRTVYEKKGSEWQSRMLYP